MNPCKIEQEQDEEEKATNWQNASNQKNFHYFTPTIQIFLSNIMMIVCIGKMLYSLRRLMSKFSFPSCLACPCSFEPPHFSYLLIFLLIRVNVSVRHFRSLSSILSPILSIFLSMRLLTSIYFPCHIVTLLFAFSRRISLFSVYSVACHSRSIFPERGEGDRDSEEVEEQQAGSIVQSV